MSTYVGYHPQSSQAVEMPEGSYEHHPVEDIEPLDDHSEKFIKLASAIRYIVSEIIRSKNAHLAAECVATAIGLQTERNSMTEIAEAYGVTRAEVSARVLEFQEQLGIGQNGFNKQTKSRRNYANTNSRRTKI